jgi:hypothetical protein
VVLGKSADVFYPHESPMNHFLKGGRHFNRTRQL